MAVIRSGKKFKKRVDDLKEIFKVKGIDISDEQATDFIDDHFISPLDFDINIKTVFDIPKSRKRKVVLDVNRKKRKNKR